MLVKKVPDHLIAQNPIDARGFEENARVRRRCERLANGLQQLDRVGDVFDHMPANYNIGGNVRAIRAVVAALKLDSSIQSSIWPNIAGVESIAGVAGFERANQLLEKQALATS